MNGRAVTVPSRLRDLVRRVAVIVALVATGWAAGRFHRDLRTETETVTETATATATATESEMETGTDTGTGTATATPRIPHRPVAEANQYALVSDLRAAVAEPDPNRQSAALDAVATRWRSQPVRWRVLVLRALCRDDDCHAVPFNHADPRARSLAPIVEGWLPRLSLDAAARARLDACGADACAVDLEGTISAITASTELPTAVAIAVSSIATATPAHPREKWMR